MFPTQRLVVWQRAHSLATQIVRELGARDSGHPLLREIMRTSCSVISNIAEGAGSESVAQFARYMGIARASAYELEAQLLLARDGGVFEHNFAVSLLAETVEIKRMLTVFQRRLKQSRREPGPRPQ